MEAQTPDGTRVATPNPTKPYSGAPTPRGTLGPKTSYAGALKSKPSDWHLEFSMDDHKLPLDLTIYGAIHQHEARKKSGTAIAPSMIWQNVYTIKFRKVPGPAPLPEGTNSRFSFSFSSNVTPFSSRRRPHLTEPISWSDFVFSP